jgi:hypothetical protein
MLSRFSDLPMDKLAHAIRELNEELINLDNLKGLRQFIPTADEVRRASDSFRHRLESVVLFVCYWTDLISFFILFHSFL